MKLVGAFEFKMKRIEIMTNCLTILGILLCIPLALSMSISDFNDLTTEELTNWEVEILEIVQEGQDNVYYFEMNTYSHYAVDNTIRENRELFTFSCWEELNCTQFYETELEILQETLLDTYEEWQQEL
tara:strand:+ start:2369 stop:2752 length:384 start_codon:yes stop_codon:yes gene_type:complete